MSNVTELVVPSLPSSCADTQKQVFMQHAARLMAVQADESLAPVSKGAEREHALADAFIALSECYGAKLKPIRWIDANGEFSVVALAENDEDKRSGFTGHYGQAFARVLSCIPTRTGSKAFVSNVLPENGWCHINHFDAEKLVNALFSQLNAH